VPQPSLNILYGLGYAPEVVLHIQEETRDMLLGEKVAEVQALRAQGGDRKSEEFKYNGTLDQVFVRYPQRLRETSE